MPSSNPFTLSLLQLINELFILGFTTPSSLLRPAALVLQLTCWYLTFQNANNYMRTAWAQIYGASCFTLFVANFFEMAMISKWSFEAQGPTSPSPPSAKPQSTSNGKAQSNGKTPAKLKVQATFLNRLKFAWNSTMSIRNVNTPHEIRNTPYFSSTNPSYIPSRSRFLIRSLATFTITYLLLDLMESAPPPPDLTLFNPSHVPVFTRLNEITFEEVVTRIVTSGVVWLAAFCIIATWNAFLEFFFVGTGLSEPKSWRPLFGSFAETYTVRGFWGKFWHQLLRKPYSNSATYFVDSILHLPKGLLSRYLKIFLTFFLSGLLHLIADLNGLHTISQSGALKTFSVQVIGIILEDSVQELWRRVSGKKEGDKTKGWEKAVGWVWTVTFLLFWSSPAWFWPQVCKKEFLVGREGKLIPFSVFAGLF